MMKCSTHTKNDTLTSSVGDGVNKLEWFIDASFTVHPDFRSHTGVTSGFGGGLGSPVNVSLEQKLNADSGTVSELVAVHQGPPIVSWLSLIHI